jgi:hypothetical protein
MARDLEPWGGDVRLPRWLRRLLRRPEDTGETPERAHERRTGRQSDKSVAAAADRAAVGILSDLYREGRGKRR